MFVKVLSSLLITFLLLSCYPQMREPADPDIAFKYYSRAIEQFQAKNYQDALIYIDQAIEKNNRLAKYFELRGDINNRQGMNINALEDYNKALRLRSFYPEVYIKIAAINYKADNFDESIRNYRKALAQDPENFDLILEIAENYIQQLHTDIAQYQLQDYLNGIKKSEIRINRKYYVLMAKLNFELQNYKIVVENIRTAEKYMPLNRNECVFYLRAMIETGALEQAYTLVSNKYKETVNESDFHFLRGLYYQKQGNIKDARTQLELSVAKKTTIFEAYTLLASLYNQMGETAKEQDILALGKQFEGARLINLE
ncbi:MAG: tetratricopeptide repeat protein [Calditrichae bacterium]|nr:tetratricopeptide repeat protein [Calditrichia bacterium]